LVIHQKELEEKEDEEKKRIKGKDEEENRYEEGEARFLKAQVEFEEKNWEAVRKNAHKGLKILKKSNKIFLNCWVFLIYQK
jgi:hypothetical protein